MPTPFPQPLVVRTSISPYGLAVGPDGNLWGWVEGAGGLGGSINGYDKSGNLLYSYNSGTYVLAGMVTLGSLMWGFDAANNQWSLNPGVGLTEHGYIENTLYWVAVPSLNEIWSRVNTPAYGHQLDRFDSTGSGVGTYAVTNSTDMQTALAVGPDGNVWSSNGTTEAQSMSLTGTQTNYSVFLSGSSISGLISDGTYLWYVDQTAGNGVWRVTTAGAATQVPISSFVANSVAYGSDGYVYVLGTPTATPAVPLLYRLDPSTATVIDYASCPAFTAGSSGWGYLMSDGTDLWMTSPNADMCKWGRFVQIVMVV